MDQFTLQNAVWFAVLMASVFINWRLGYRKGVIDSYTHGTIPVVELLLDEGHLNAGEGNVDAKVLTAQLMTLAIQRKLRLER